VAAKVTQHDPCVDNINCAAGGLSLELSKKFLKKIMNNPDNSLTLPVGRLLL